MDTDSPTSASSSSPSTSEFRIGDKVELSDDYLQRGDAGSGPLKQFDRGTVVEVQTGSRGDNQIRVLHNTRKWWYQVRLDEE